MADGNPIEGHLSEAKAMELLAARRMPSDNAEQEDQAAPDAEEELQAEEDTLEDEQFDEADEVEDEPSPSEEDTEEELDAEELEKGYLRQADYTRKTQELASDRAAFEAEKRQFQAQAQQQLDALKERVEAFAIPTEPEPDWAALAKELDPKEYQQLQAEHQTKTAKRQQAAQLYQQMRQDEAKQRVEQTADYVLSRVPEWNNETHFKADFAAMDALTQEYGFAPNEAIRNANGPMLMMLRDFMAMKKAARARRKTPAPKKRVKGQATVRVDEAKEAAAQATSRFQKTGSKRDAASLIMARRS